MKKFASVLIILITFPLCLCAQTEGQTLSKKKDGNGEEKGALAVFNRHRNPDNHDGDSAIKEIQSDVKELKDQIQDLSNMIKRLSENESEANGYTLEYEKKIEE